MMPTPYWETNYQADRRNHHHRCVCCNRIVTTGEPVLMRRMAKGTKVLHVECASRGAINGFSWRELFEAHGMEYLASVGYGAAKTWMATAAICRPGVHK